MLQDVRGDHKLDEQGNPAGGHTSGLDIEIEWQTGPLTGADKKEPNGAFVEGVLSAARDRLEFYQKTEFKCNEDALAIQKIGDALSWMQTRTKRRSDREPNEV